MITFICYPKCTTCQKAKKWLDDNNVDYVLRDIKNDNPCEEELSEWYKKAACRSEGFSIRAVCFTNLWSLKTNFL